MELPRILNTLPPVNEMVSTQPPLHRAPLLRPFQRVTASARRRLTPGSVAGEFSVEANSQSDLEGGAPISANDCQKPELETVVCLDDDRPHVVSKGSLRSLPVAVPSNAQPHRTDERCLPAVTGHQPLQPVPPWDVPKHGFSESFTLHMHGKSFLEILETVWQICSHARQAAYPSTPGRDDKPYLDSDRKRTAQNRASYTHLTSSAAFRRVEKDYKLIQDYRSGRPTIRDSKRCLFIEVMHQHTSRQGIAKMDKNSFRVAKRLAALAERFGVGCLACFAFRRADLSKVKDKDLAPFLDNIENCCPTLKREIVQLSLLLPSLLAMKPPEKPLWIECIPFDNLKHYRQHSLDELLGPPPQAIPQPAVAHIG